MGKKSKRTDDDIPQMHVSEYLIAADCAIGGYPSRRIKISTDYDGSVIMKLPPEKSIIFPHRLPVGAIIESYITNNGKSGLQITQLKEFLKPD